MRSLSLVCLALALPLAACTVGGTDDAPADDDDTPITGQIAGSITASGTWTGTITLTADATIESGVTIHVAPGTVFEAKMGTTLRVKGTLQVEGTAAAPVTMNPTVDAQTWAGIVVDAGGAATIAHATGDHAATLLYCHAGAVTCVLDHVTWSDVGSALVAEDDASILSSRISKMSNGGISMTAGTVTIRDSYILTSTGDLVVQNGGALVIEYSEIGEAIGSYEHCDLHINGAESLRISHSNIRAAVYGMMIGGTSGAVMQYNNFVENDAGNDVSPVGENTAVDLRFNYWDQGAPTGLGAAYDVSSPAAARIADAGPRA